MNNKEKNQARYRAKKRSHPTAWDEKIFLLGKEPLKLTSPIGKGTGRSSSN